MRFAAALAIALGLLQIQACSTTSKTRLDCYQDCKARGLKWTGIVSRTERYDDQGVLDSKEVCRCNIEEPI